MDDLTYRRARKNVRKKKGFYRHLSVYTIMALFFFFMNILTDPFDLWFFFPMLPWGVALMIHYVSVFGIPKSGVLTEEWEQEEMDRELRRLGGATKRLPARFQEHDTEELDLKPVKKVKPQKTWRDDELV